MHWLILLAWFVRPPVPPDPHAGRYTRALGVSCSYCHEEGRWTRSALPPFAATLRMERATAAIDSGPLASRGAATCFMCHRGSRRPAPLEESAWRPVFDDWPATATVSARDAGKPARDVYRNVQVLGALPAGDVRIAMSMIVASLGVNCEYCHAGDEWDSDNKPAKKTAREMMRLEPLLPRTTAAAAPVHCYFCHAGAPLPPRGPSERERQPDGGGAR